jgi:type II secretory pathway pseudopilin PulG
MSLRPTRRVRGHTLVESVVSMAVFATIVGGIFSAMRSSSGVLHESLRASAARRHCADVVEVVGRELEQADPTTLTIDATHPEGDRVQLQVPLAYSAGAVTWGVSDAPTGAGTPYPNATATYLLTQRQGETLWTLVRRVVGANGAQVGADQPIVSGVDVPDATRGKGFVVTRSNHLVTLSVRVRLAGDVPAAHDDLVRSQTVTVQMRNS